MLTWTASALAALCRGEYAMELALLVTAAGLLWRKGGAAAAGAADLLASPAGWPLAGAGLILLVEMLLVFPALDLRGR